jgi:uncharacterized membrane protein
MGSRVSTRVASKLWVVPLLCVFAGLVASTTTIAIDRAFDHGLISPTFTGGPDAALQILATIAASMVSLAALVLTITMVVVQLAMGQFSPRIVQPILRDRPSQVAIGVFVATFVHAMLTMREVKSEPNATVPGLAIIVAYLLVFASVVLLVAYVHHLGQALRVSALIEIVGTDTRKLIDELFPHKGPEPEMADASVIAAPESGVITHVDRDRLVAIAENAQCTLELVPALGQFVPAGSVLFRVHGARDAIDERAVQRGINLELERTLDEDAAYGFRLLVDIAERSLSDSAFQDPTTAIQAIDRLHDCLRQLARRPMHDGVHRDAQGDVRLVVPAMNWDAFVHLAFEEIRRAGVRSPQIVRRLEAALRDLLAIAPAERRPVLQHQLDQLERAVAEVEPDREAADFLRRPDPEGLGERASTSG